MRSLPPVSAPVLALMAALAAGCTGEATIGPAYPPPPPPSPAAVTVTAGPAPVADDEVVYDDAPPPVNIETYPSVVYGGAPVYYVGGVWYRRGPQGWGRYNGEPAGLARERAAHANDGRWAHEGAPRPAAPRGRPARPAPREGRP